MNVELQIQSSVLGSIAANAIQARLRTTCFPTIGEIYLDHADVTRTPVEVFAGNGTARLRVPIDVFLVRRADLLGAPNAVPPGATAAAGTVALLLELSISGTALSLRCIDADLGGLGAALGAAAAVGKTAIVNAIGSAVTTDLKPALTQLGLPNPSSSRIELAGGVVAIRFEPAGPPQARLFPGQDWGIFLDGPAVEQLAKSKVPKAMQERLTSFVLNAHWRPNGTVPHVDMDYSGKAQVPDPFAGDVSGSFACDFSITGPAMRTLRTTVHWSLAIDLGDFSPAFLDKAVREMIEVAVFQNVVKAGGVPAGDHTFTLDSALPQVSFSGARLNYSGILASPAGMTVGGPVKWPIPPMRETVDFSVTNFGLPHRIELCSQLAKSGSGAPHWTATLGELKTKGRVWLDNGGSFCGFEIISPGDWLQTYMYPPESGNVGESHEINIVIPSNVALGITRSVRLIVRTARGVRLIDLGVPPAAVIDSNGNVTNAQLTYIDDCLYLPVGPEDPFRIDWGDDLSDLLTNPVDWFSYLDELNGLDVQLITLSGLEPGELVQFRSRDHSLDITADLSGQAVVPALLSLTDQAAPAMLTRVNRQSIEGHFSVASATFERQASLPAGVQSSLSSDVDGSARLRTEFADRVTMHAISQFGDVTLIGNDQLSAATNRASVEVKTHSTLDRCAEVPGVTALHQVPGFSDAGLVIAETSDGSMLVLDLRDGGVRVAGTFAGPIGPLEVSGHWGVATGPDRTTIFRVSPNENSQPVHRH